MPLKALSLELALPVARLRPWDYFDGQNGRRTKFAKTQGFHT